MSHREPFVDLQHDPAYLEMMKLFEELTFAERMRRMFAGLSQPVDSGEHKFAKLQMQRLSAPFLATVLPLLLVALLIVTGSRASIPETDRSIFILRPDTTLDPFIDPPPPPDELSWKHEAPQFPAVSPRAPEFKPPNEIPDPLPPMSDPPIRIWRPPSIPGFPGLPDTDTIIGQEVDKVGDPKGETAVLLGLRWLKQQQQSDGSWPKNKDAMTALAVLSFLAHGERPGSSAEFGETVQAGIQYLMRSQRADGTWPGNYQHPIATYALCEAYAMTHHPEVRKAAAKAVLAVIRGQHASGGWDYGMKQSDRDDTSVMGWAAQALKAAALANVLDDPDLIDRACRLSVQGFLKNADSSGGFGYTGKGRGGLSAVGTLCLQFHGAGSHEQVRKTLALMDDWRLDWEKPVVPGGSPQYYFYYATQAKFQAGKDTQRWRSWNAAMIPEYTRAQKILSSEKSGYRDHEGKPQCIGWWENTDQHSDRPVMDTCLAAMQLMVYYRFLPTMRLPALDPDVTTADARDIRVDIVL